MTVNTIITDIEGTTSAISFVTETLFPYASYNLPAFIETHQYQPDVAEQLDAVREEIENPEADVEEVIDTLLHWIGEDRKATPLKILQGMIWEYGYADGSLKGHIYPDACRALQQWHDEGKNLYIYSSGSIQAQRSLFGHTEYGDLNPLFKGNFDTTTGNKREAESYAAILQNIDKPAEEVVFLSDVKEELDAAAANGIHTIALCRPEDNKGEALAGHTCVASFSQIQLP